MEKEWSTAVPLHLQLFLCAFINARSVHDTSDIGTYMHSKIVRLYAIFDSLLNLHNKKHHGIIQEMNSTELMVNYKSISHSFRLSQEMGMASGLLATERHWQRQSTDEEAYYSYAIKKVPLHYESRTKGIGAHMVSLRDCFCINMIDNLVTVTHLKDPEPGSARTG